MSVRTAFCFRFPITHPLDGTDESLSPLLFPYDPSTSENLAAQSAANSRNPPTSRTPIIKASDLIPQETKVELVLGAEDDIKNADRIMREIQVLVERGADGSGDLACEFQPRDGSDYVNGKLIRGVLHSS